MSDKSVHPRKAKAIRLGVYEAQKPGAVVASDQQRQALTQTPKKKSKSASKPKAKGPEMKEVQARAKELGVKANGSKASILARIAKAESIPATDPSDTPPNDSKESKDDDKPSKK